MTSCSLVEIFHCFWGTCYLHLQGAGCDRSSDRLPAYWEDDCQWSWLTILHECKVQM